MDAELATLAQDAAGTVASLLATDMWGLARDTVGRLWQRVHPDRAEAVRAELAESHAELVTVAGADHDRMVDELTAEWRGRLRRLLSADPGIAAELSQLMEQVLVPALATTAPTTTVRQTATVEGDNAVVTQVGRDLRIEGTR